MSFDWLGTFNASQIARFAEFARNQRGLVDARLAHLNAEIRRVGSLTFAYDSGGVPKGYATIKPADSYISKLLVAYEVLGGDAFYDLNIRSSDQPVFLIKADETVPATRMSSGELLGQPGQADAYSAELMHQARGWLDRSLLYRREYLERKIRRALDYVDQLQAEMTLLDTIAKDNTVNGSLEHSLKEVQALIGNPGYRAVYDDKGADPHGHKTSAPLAAYPSGPDRTEVVTDQRGFGGFEPATEKA